MSKGKTKTSWWSEITALLCKPIDNSFSIAKYDSGELLLVGDTVRVSRRLRGPATGVIVALDKHRHVDNFTVEAVYVEIAGKRYRVCPRRITLQQRETSFRHRRAAVDSEVTESFLAGEYDQVPSIITSYFDDASLLCASRPSSRLTRRLLEAVRAKADQAIMDRAASGPTHQGIAFVSMLRCRSYASALLGDGLRQDDLDQAVEAVKEIHDTTEAPYWTADFQDLYLSAARMCIIGNDMDRARKLLQSKRSFSKHQDQRRLLKKLVRKTVRPAEDAALRSQCLSYLDFVRSPFASDVALFHDSMWARFEWSAIIGKLLMEPESETDWQAVVARVFR